MDSWLGRQLEDVRSRLTSADEGALWLLFYDDPHGEAVIATAIDHAMDQMEPKLIQGIATVLDGVPAKAALLAVVRSSGQLATVDRNLWLELLRLTGPSTHLIDLVVVGDATSHSIRGSADA